MVTVHVWKPSGQNTGHASLSIDVTGYISWWPDLSKKFLKAPGDPRRKLSDDESEEGRKADHQVQIARLDESAIALWWEKFERQGLDWELHDLNCAHVVVLALKAGGADERIGMLAAAKRKLGPATSVMSPLIAYNISTIHGIATAFQGDGLTIGYRWADWFTPVWTPMDALRYAQSIGA
jgi:hypothetical protein